MIEQLGEEALDLLFHEARSHGHWLDKPVSDETLRALYNLMKWGPTSMNGNPVRILFLRTPEAKQRLLPSLSSGNVEKTMSAPVTAIIAYDLHFYEQLPKLFPHYPAARDMFAGAPALAEATAKRNATLQGGYFILAARALGLDCGPMSGFDNAKVDEEFFAAGQIRSDFLCNLGYADRSQVYPRNPRLDFDQVCQLL